MDLDRLRGVICQAIGGDETAVVAIPRAALSAQLVVLSLAARQNPYISGVRRLDHGARCRSCDGVVLRRIGGKWRSATVAAR